MAAAKKAIANDKFPPQVKYIVGNEGCERYSYYGMRSILIIFMVNYLLLEKGHATEVMHLFMGAAYFLPLVGSMIADQYWGRYKTILWLSLLYCVGHGILAVFDGNEYGLYVGLAFIALGAGAIKPCVSAFVGDQFTVDQKEMMTKVYNLFYWMINFGSVFSTLITPWTLKHYGGAVAFGIPGILMAIATLIFWLGNKHYVKMPPSGPDKHNFWAVLRTGIAGKVGLKAPGIILAVALAALLFPRTIMEQSLVHAIIAVFVWVVYTLVSWSVLLIAYNLITGVFAKTIKDKHPAGRVEEFYISLSIAKVFAAVSMFWALFDQHASTWVLQAENMNRAFPVPSFLQGLFGAEITIESSQVSFINPLLVLTLIPIFNFIIYPAVNRVYELTPLRKMSWGMVMAAGGFATVAFIQYPMDDGQPMHVAWQLIPYLFMTMAEVMISITGLEFAYTQAPKSLKSTIMSFWLLTVFFGNIITVYMVKINFFPLNSGNFFMCFAALMLVVAGFFALIARTHKMRYFLRES